jgi:uncharacterized protein (TIGR00369 family)
VTEHPPIEELPERMGIVLLECSARRVIGTMPVAGNRQGYGALHGGASLVFAETLGGAAAGMHGGPNRIAVGVDINATHHRAATGGVLTGVATPVHLGRTVTSYEVVVTDDRDRRISTARITCLLLNA